jgi:transcriptional regulator with XRE-family HTH domain
MTFGQNLQQLRNKARLSQAGLAERSGISVNTIQNWEIDRSRPRIDALPRLAKALGVELVCLIDVNHEGFLRKKNKRQTASKNSKRF